MVWDVSGNYLMKNDLMILNILANNNWKRPIYFATTVGSDNYLNLEPYFQLEGLTYRIVPIRNDQRTDIVPGRVNKDIMYNNVMNKFVFGNMNDEHVYLDENNLRMTTNFRINFSRLAEELMNAGRRDSAIKVLDKCVEVMPDKQVPYNYFMTKVAELYYRAAGIYGVTDTLAGNDLELNRKNELIGKGNAIAERISEIYNNNMEYYLSLKGTPYYKLVDTDMNQAPVHPAGAFRYDETNQPEGTRRQDRETLHGAGTESRLLIGTSYLRVPARNEGDHSFARPGTRSVFSPCCCFNNSFVRCSGGWRPRKGPLPDVRRRAHSGGDALGAGGIAASSGEGDFLCGGRKRPEAPRAVAAPAGRRSHGRQSHGTSCQRLEHPDPCLSARGSGM